MKWVSLIIGGIIIVGGVWLLMKPSSVDSPAVEVSTEESAVEGDGLEGVMEDGTLDTDEGVTTEKKDETDNGSSQSNNADPVAEEPVGDPIFHVLVEYTTSGFSPKTVTINKGETVRFVGQTNVWPAGANHPTHTLYPEKSANDCLGTSFDACRVLQAGEFWEFTFNEVGTWGFHNHTRANDRGTVVVK